MHVLAIHSSVRSDGLTAKLARAVLSGAMTEGAETELVGLNELHLEPCQGCPPEGWGQCRQGQGCLLLDGFEGLRQKMLAADALVFATPVYFGDLSETARSFLDRLRRVEWSRREASPFKGKPVVGIAAAGGSGSGAPTAVVSLERYMTYLRLEPVVYLPVSRQNRDLQLDAALLAGVFMARRLKEGSSSSG